MYARSGHAGIARGSRALVTRDASRLSHFPTLRKARIVLTWPRDFSAGRLHLAKRVSKKQIKELKQGAIIGAPLPPAEKDELKQETLTQVVKHYMRKFPNCVVLTRVGNFYELYHEHADEYAPKLGLRVATKGKDGVSMAGFPLVQLGRYMKALVQDLDKHVALCEEFPQYAGGKLQTPIPRRVSRVITQGTLIDEEFVQQDKNNFLLSVHYDDPTERAKTASGPGTETTKGDNADAKVGLAWIDVSTGEFFLQTTDRKSLPSSLMRIGATEVVLSALATSTTREEIALSLGLHVERISSPTAADTQATPDAWLERLDQPMGEKEKSDITAIEMAASQQLFDYIDRHLLDLQLRPMRPQRREQHGFMSIDRSSIRGLELLKTARDGLGKGSLLNTVQRTVTKGGARLLSRRLVNPSVIPKEIEYRLNLIAVCIAAQEIHQAIIAHLRGLYDMHRTAQKFALDRGDADDLLCLASTFFKMKDMVALLTPYTRGDNPGAQALKTLVSQLNLEGPEHMSSQIRSSIDEQGVVAWLTQGQEELSQDAEGSSEIESAEITANASSSQQGRRVGGARIIGPRAQKGDPWVMQKTASPQLEELHGQVEALMQEKDELQQSLQEQLSAPKLVLRYDSKYGHICQSPRTKGFNSEALEELGASMVGNLKTVKTFYLSQWTALGRRMDNIEFEIRQQEQEIFFKLRQLVVDNLVALRKNASVMDELDVATAFSTLAMDEGWTRPIITTNTSHSIVGGRHPTVKLGLQEKGHSFVSNDLYLDRKERAWLITGPNMAGKSTFLRQNALITILAQVGCYVPAEYAEIGIVDKIFSRIGAADDLFRNESTFMVEMLETATILRDATERSFVIMDEVGRGTAPEDGTAVAYASLHHLYNTNQCRTLFATHFHDLADQTKDWEHLAQYCTDILEHDKGAFTFVHKLQRGVNRKSHALRVAKMAGLPSTALETAQQVLVRRKALSDSAIYPWSH